MGDGTGFTREQLARVLAVAEEAGRRIMAVYADESRWAVETKADDSPLTAADLAAHEAIKAALEAVGDPALAGIPVLSEESAPAELAGRRSWPRCWVVDPLDGTREFIARNGEFSVNIALVQGDEAVLGVVHGPASGVSYVAARGLGAFKVSAGGWQAIRVRALPHPALPGLGETASPAAVVPVRLTVSRRHGLERLAAFEQAVAGAFGPVTSVAAGSAFKTCAVAEGLADCYPRFGPTSEWDTAAAQVVLEEAGGWLLSATGEPFCYNRRDSLLNGDFLAVGSQPARWLACWPEDGRA